MKPPLLVVAAILEDGASNFLMSSRPAGKNYADYWEFPGGKVEAGESLWSALARELREELGLRLSDEAMPVWRNLQFSYPKFEVCLHFFRIPQTAWFEQPSMREGQQIRWIPFAALLSCTNNTNSTSYTSSTTNTTNTENTAQEKLQHQIGLGPILPACVPVLKYLGEELHL